jgi:hypothetical protein
MKKLRRDTLVELMDEIDSRFRTKLPEDVSVVP